MNLKTVSLIAVMSLGAASVAQGKVIHLGAVDGDSGTFSDQIGKNKSFSDLVRFRVTDTSTITAAFVSFFNVLPSSFSVQLQERTAPHTWADVGASFTTNFSFADLTKGAYRFAVTGLTGNRRGSWTGDFTVAAVPEADAWMMMLVGAGLVGYQLRRKQNSLNQPTIAG
jgi:hypothetical protein